MAFLSPSPPSINNSAGFWSCPVAFPFLNLLISLSMSTSFCGSAVCKNIDHFYPLSLSVPSCSS